MSEVEPPLFRSVMDYTDGNQTVAAEILGISIKTVDRHRTSMMQKLAVHSVAQLIAVALREDLIDPSLEL